MLSDTWHIHRRKRAHQKNNKLRPYPHPHVSVRTLDRVAVVAGVMGPVMTLPQAWKIYSMQDASGVSMLSWSSLTFVALIWLFYGVFHRENPIVISQSLWVFVNITVVLGIIMYG